MKRTWHALTAVGGFALVVASCGGTTSATTEALSNAAGATTSTTAGATSEAPADTSTTTTASPTTTIFDRLVEVPLEAPPFEDVTITTADGLDLYAKFWPGNDVAVLFGHDFDNPTPGASGQRAPQSSDSIIPFAAAIVNDGWTVLAPDFRGHGQSAGEYDVRASQIDLKAVHGWLTAEGYETIIVIGWVGSGTAAVVLDVADAEVDFDGIAMVFSPLQDTGMDAQQVIGGLDTPTFFIGSNAGSSARAAKFLEAAAVDSRGITVFDRTPSGLQFIDVYGPELAGRLLQFLDDATA